MASQLFPKGAGHILGASTAVDMTANNIKFLFYVGSDHDDLGVRR